MIRRALQPYLGLLARHWHIQAPDLDRWSGAQLLVLAADVLHQTEPAPAPA